YEFLERNECHLLSRNFAKSSGQDGFPSFFVPVFGIGKLGRKFSLSLSHNLLLLLYRHVRFDILFDLAFTIFLISSFGFKLPALNCLILCPMTLNLGALSGRDEICWHCNVSPNQMDNET